MSNTFHLFIFLAVFSWTTVPLHLFDKRCTDKNNITKPQDYIASICNEPKVVKRGRYRIPPNRIPLCILPFYRSLLVYWFSTLTVI